MIEIGFADAGVAAAVVVEWNAVRNSRMPNTKYRIRQLAYIYYDKMWEHAAAARNCKSVSQSVSEQNTTKNCYQKFWATEQESTVCWCVV